MVFLHIMTFTKIIEDYISWNLPFISTLFKYIKDRQLVQYWQKQVHILSSLDIIFPLLLLLSLLLLLVVVVVVVWWWWLWWWHTSALHLYNNVRNELLFMSNNFLLRCGIFALFQIVSEGYPALFSKQST